LRARRTCAVRPRTLASSNVTRCAFESFAHVATHIAHISLRMKDARVCIVVLPRMSDNACADAHIRALSVRSLWHCPVCDNADAGKRTLRQTTSEVNNKTMGKSIRDAMIRTPRMVTDRHVVTRVVVERQEDDPLLGTLAQADVAPVVERISE
jgi:hypothetical protein